MVESRRSSERRNRRSHRIPHIAVVLALGATVAAPVAVGAVEFATVRLRQVALRGASDGAAFDKFGWQVALSVDTALVTATEDDDHGSDSGAAYVFARRANGAKPWRETKKITPSDGAAGDLFGFAADVSGDSALVTARDDDDNGTDAGSAYVFERDLGGAENWGGAKKLFASDPAAGDAFGWSATLDGNTAVVGSPFGSSTTGAAYLFERDQGGAGNWGFVKKLTASDAAAQDRFGRSMSLDGDTLVVTADGNDDAGSSSGAAYVFARNAGGADNWGQVRKLTASDPNAVDHFGISCALSGGTLVVGAHRDDDNGNESGSAYVFERDFGGENNWGQAQKLTAADGATADSFGRATAIRGDTIAVGAYAHEHGTLGVRAGAVYLFERDHGGSQNWGQTQELRGRDLVAEDVFGWAMALGADEALVGAPHLDEVVGAEKGTLYAFATRPPKTTQASSYMRQAPPRVR